MLAKLAEGDYLFAVNRVFKYVPKNPSALMCELSLFVALVSTSSSFSSSFVPFNEVNVQVGRSLQLVQFRSQLIS